MAKFGTRKTLALLNYHFCNFHNWWRPLLFFKNVVRQMLCARSLYIIYLLFRWKAAAATFITLSVPHKPVADFDFIPSYGFLIYILFRVSRLFALLRPVEWILLLHSKLSSNIIRGGVYALSVKIWTAFALLDARVLIRKRLILSLFLITPATSAHVMGSIQFALNGVVYTSKG